MTKTKTLGVIAGKFYPPHNGHFALIDAARAGSDQVLVIVCDKPEYKIPGKLRASWIKQLRPDVKVVVYDQKLADDDTEGWAKLAIEYAGRVPDAVYTSEDYGLGWAKAIGCRHVMVDQARIKIPVSGTKVRTNPLDNLQFLQPLIRAYFVKRVCVVGAESTGKTTLAQDLARHYQTVWVPEYGRLYTEGKYISQNEADWQTSEFVHIAKMQNQAEDELAKMANRVLISDTDSFATSIWHERYVGNKSREVEKISKGRRCDLYLLTDVTTPFDQDGLRDGEKIRDWMNHRFEEELTKKRANYMFVTGSREKRLQSAVAGINKILATADW